MSDPARYEAWYQQPRGAWIGALEFDLLWRLSGARPGASLLDVGCGSGHFSRRFAAAGLSVVGLDPDPAMLAFAHARDGGIAYVQGVATRLPFADAAFDHCAAVTSLCFVADVQAALAEMWRVSRRGLLLGLLNRHSLLYRRRRGRGGYRGARWDSAAQVKAWARALRPAPAVRLASAVFLPGGGAIARALEQGVPASILWGGFLAASFERPQRRVDRT